MSFTLGTDLHIDYPVFLAPMSGVTDLPFRRLVRHFGAGLVFSEMIASRAMVEQVQGSVRISAAELDEPPFALQLAGCDPEVMAEAARLCVKRGATMIDINFGCPVKKIVNKMGGSALMRDEPLAEEIMIAVREAVQVPVSVKMRLGWDDAHKNAPSIAAKAEKAGLDMVTVHGRTREQLYRGTADWAAIRPVREAVSLPLIANGDICDAHDARKALEQSGADGVMIGRACYGKPWKVKQIIDELYGEDGAETAPQRQNRAAIIRAHYDDLLEYYGQKKGMLIARKHLAWYLKDQAGASEIRKRINDMSNPEDVRAQIDAFYAA